MLVFFNIRNIFTVFFLYQFNACLLNKSNNFFFFKKKTDPKLLNSSDGVLLLCLNIHFTD